MHRKNVFVALSVLIILGAFFFVTQKRTPSSRQESTATTPTPALPKEIQVNLTPNGFSPKEIKIKKGEAIRFMNSTEEDATINSDNHPTHQLYPELNLGQFKKNQVLIHIFTKPGKYTYHNHYHPETKGTIIVE